MAYSSYIARMDFKFMGSFNGKKLDIYLSAKGFFTMVFDSKQDKNVILNHTWLWGESTLLLKLSDPNFDLATKSFSVMLIWVRLPNLPMHY